MIAITKLGKVVVTMAATWSNRPVCAEPAAKFVESDKGENLSPQHAPDKIAPAIKAGFNPMVLPMAIKAIPNVADTVQADPKAIPTTAHIKVIKGKKTPGERSFNP